MLSPRTVRKQSGVGEKRSATVDGTVSYVVFTVSRTWREGAAWPLREQSILLT